MNRLQKIFMGLLILAVISLTIFSQIQMGYVKEERKKVIGAENQAYNNAKKAEAMAMEAQKMAAEALKEKNKAQLMKEELEACKGKK